MHAGDKAQGGYTGGEPVATADAVTAGSRVGRDGEGTVARAIVKEKGMVAPEPGGGVMRVGGEATGVCVITAGVSSLSTGNGEGCRASVNSALEATNPASDVRPAATDCDNSMMVDVCALPEGVVGDGGAAAAGCPPQPNARAMEVSATGRGAFSVFPQGSVDPRAAGVTMADVVAGEGGEAGMVYGQKPGESQADTMDRLAQSLAQVSDVFFGGFPKRLRHDEHL